MGEEKQKAPTGGLSGFFSRVWHAIVVYWIGMKYNLIEIFTFHKKFDLKKVPRRPGEVAVITGGARGIGYEVVKKLLILDMHVVIGCRNESAGHEAIEKIRKKGVSTGTSDVIPLDLMSLDSVRSFASKVSGKFAKIHVLINNGGIMIVPYNITKDGNESQFQTNYLSHFLLTNLLLPKLIRAGRAGKASRIVNVSSVAHYGGKINFNDINMQLNYSANMAYMSSKLMQVVSTKDLNTRLEKEGLHVRAFSVHPGVVLTGLYENICLVRTFGFIFRLFYKTPEQGADGVTYAAISSKFEGEGGYFFANCKKYSVNSLAKKEGIQKQLWDISCKLTAWEDTPLNEIVRQALANRKNHQNSKMPQKILTPEERPTISEKMSQDEFEIVPEEHVLESTIRLSTSSSEDEQSEQSSNKSQRSSSSSIAVEAEKQVPSNLSSEDQIEINVEDFVTSLIATATAKATESMSMPDIIVTSFESEDNNSSLVSSATSSSAVNMEPESSEPMSNKSSELERDNHQFHGSEIMESA